MSLFIVCAIFPLPARCMIEFSQIEVEAYRNV